MADKPKKFGILLYSLCMQNGAFFCTLLHHCPGVEKMKRLDIKPEDLDGYCTRFKQLSKRYGGDGALAWMLVSMLKDHGHHIYADNAFMSAQFAFDCKEGVNGSAPTDIVVKTHVTGTQRTTKPKKPKKQVVVGTDGKPVVDGKGKVKWATVEEEVMHDSFAAAAAAAEKIFF